MDMWESSTRWRPTRKEADNKRVDLRPRSSRVRLHANPEATKKATSGSIVESSLQQRSLQQRLATIVARRSRSRSFKRTRATWPTTTHKPRPVATSSSSTHERGDHDDGSSKCCKAFAKATRRGEFDDGLSTPSAKAALARASEALAKAKAAPSPTGEWRKDAISPYDDCEKPPQWTTVYVKYPKGTPGSRRWKKFNWIDNVSVFDDLKRAVANKLEEEWGYRYNAESIAFMHEIDGRQLPIPDDFDAYEASETLEKGEEIYLHMVSPEKAADPNPNSRPTSKKND